MLWTKGEVPGTTYGLSSNGWIDMDLFKGWFETHFLRHAVSARPLLLLLDGHSSHYSPDVIRLAKEHNVIILTLVPHTTHEMQPLDTCVFASLKNHWRDACHKFVQENPTIVITKYHFSPLLHESWFKAMIPSSIINGFKYCGIYPFNPQAVLEKLTSTPIANPTNTKPTGNCHADRTQSLKATEVNFDTPANIATVIEESSDTTGSAEITSFTADEEIKYRRRFEEGYDLPDERYTLWLRLNHLTLASVPVGTPFSVAESLPDVTPAVPVTIEPAVSTPPAIVTPTSASTASLVNNRTDSAFDDSLATPASDNHSVGSSSHASSFSSPPSSNRISKYLVQYVPQTPTTHNKAQRILGKRVLTSSEGLKILEEKEEKKRKVAEEKQQRKDEREQRKKEKEKAAEDKAKRKSCSQPTASRKKRKTGNDPDLMFTILLYLSIAGLFCCLKFSFINGINT